MLGLQFKPVKAVMPINADELAIEWMGYLAAALGCLDLEEVNQSLRYESRFSQLLPLLVYLFADQLPRAFVLTVDPLLMHHLKC